MQLFDEQGNPVEAKTKEEVEVEIAERTKGSEESQAKLKEYEAKVAELEQEVNPKWREFRQEYNKLKKFVDDKGIKQEETQITREEMQKEAQRAAENSLLNSHKNRVLSQYDEKTRPVVERYLEKLVTGEQVNLDNIDTFIGEAERLAVPNSSSASFRRAMSANGRPPAEPKENHDFSETDAGKNLGSKMGLTI